VSPRLHLRALWVALLAVGFSTLACAGSPAPLSLTQLSRKAGFIFSGRVIRVERPALASGKATVMQVTLRVERALRGTHPGETFTLREWMGAWDSGPQFRVGQRVLLFLYPRSKAGLTSVVGGRLGQFDLDTQGNIVLRGDQQRLLLGPDDTATGPARATRPPRLRYRDFAGRVQRVEP